MRKSVEQQLLQFKRKTISIDELEKLASKTTSYEHFASVIIELEQDRILQMIKAKGRNRRTPSLAFRYKINTHMLNRNYHQQLQQYRLQFHPLIKLDVYFKLDPAVWEKDLPYLKKINNYINNHGFPKEKVPAPERSFELVGDEKWIEEKGNELLQRIHVWEWMNIFPVADPLMFAVNPSHFYAPQHFHLIVENKTTYQALLPVLTETSFSTLIYGSGNKIAKSIENFTNQFPVEGNHTIFYFGDIDQAGITIWHSLTKRERAVPALPFYEACLRKKAAYGKTNQRPNQAALQAFLTYFAEAEQQKIRSLFEAGAYYPQEVLQTKELQHIWLNANWPLLKKS